MSYTFGAGTGDDVPGSMTQNLGLSATRNIVAGWFYPTTLTAGRCYVGNGTANFGMYVDTTTSELRFKSQRATTAGEWTTSGAGITTNKWHFIAFYSGLLSSAATDRWQAWVGTEVTPPALVTTTQAVAPAGNLTGGASLVAGNASSTATVAFQGDIATLVRFNSATNSADNAAAIPVASYTAPTAAEYALMLDTLIMPLWRNGSMLTPVRHTGVLAVVSEIDLLDLSSPTQVLTYRYGSSATAAIPIAVTVNGATYTPNTPSRILPSVQSFVRPLCIARL